MFAVNRTLTNGKQCQVMKTDFLATPLWFLHKDYSKTGNPSHDIVVQALLISRQEYPLFTGRILSKTWILQDEQRVNITSFWYVTFGSVRKH